jgi:hypothetical protein
VHKINLGFPHGHRKLAAGPNAKNSRYPVAMLFFLQPVEQWTTNLNGRRVVYFREVENDKSSTSKSKWDKGLILSLSYSMRYVMMLVFQTKHRELYVNPAQNVLVQQRLETCLPSRQKRCESKSHGK